MKTINTVLPVYDSIVKQCYERANVIKVGQDQPIPVITPEYRLPSMLWNVESDSPGQITKVELLNKTITGDDIAVPAVNGFPIKYETFTVAGNAITSAINSAGSALASVPINISGKKGEYITVEFNLTITSGVGFWMQVQNGDGYPRSTYFIATAGVNSHSLRILDDFTNAYLSFGNVNACEWQSTAIIVKRGNITDIFDTTASYIQGWNNNTYDTFTFSGANVTSCIKTTAAGIATANNTVIWGTVPGGISINERIRIKASLTLNSGTAPKITLIDGGTGTSISNIVTLQAGDNYLVLKTTSTAASFAIMIFNNNMELVNCSIVFSLGSKTVIPELFTNLTDDYFQYNGDTLCYLLPYGDYYLKISTANGNVYYSDWLRIDCVYENLISDLTNIDYETFTKFNHLDGNTIIQSAIETGASGTAKSVDLISIKKGEKITVIFYYTQNPGSLPVNTYIFLFEEARSYLASNFGAIVPGLNIITLIPTFSTDIASFYIQNTATVNYSTSEIIILREYSQKYLRIDFSNSCDLGDILYQNGLIQSIWLESETMETTFPMEEEGKKNGEGKFIRTFARQVKKYLTRTMALPDYMVDVFNRMRLHNQVSIIDLVGYENDIYNLEVETEWLYDDKYYAKNNLTFDYDEAVIVSACCENIT